MGEGFDDLYNVGRIHGYDNGFERGYDIGYSDGLTEGKRIASLPDQSEPFDFESIAIGERSYTCNGCGDIEDAVCNCCSHRKESDNGQ